MNCPRCRHPGFHPESMCEPPDGASYDDPVCLGCYEELARSRFRDARDREARNRDADDHGRDPNPPREEGRT